MTLHDLRELAEMVGYPTKTHQLVTMSDEVVEQTDGEIIDYLRFMIWQIDNGKVPA